MNSHTDEEGVKYVLSLSSPNKKISLKKVNIKDIPASAVGRIIRCKKISSMREAAEQLDSVKAEDNSDDVELTVVSTTQNTIIVGNSEERQLERPPKKIKIELPTQINKIDMPETKNIITDTQVLTSPKMQENDYVEMGDEEYDDDDDDYIDDEEEEYISDESYSAPRMVRPVIRNSAIKSANANYGYVSPSNYRVKRTSSESEKRRSKAKMFRTEWLNIDIFRDWLDRDPNDPCKARCLACNTVMNAGKSELEKHAAGAKHCRALQQMQLLQQQAMMQELATGSVDDSNEEVRLSDESAAAGTQPLIMGDPQALHSRALQLEVLNKIATAVESMSSVMGTILEKIVSNQDSLVQVLQQLANK